MPLAIAVRWPSPCAGDASATGSLSGDDRDVSAQGLRVTFDEPQQPALIEVLAAGCGGSGKPGDDIAFPFPCNPSPSRRDPAMTESLYLNERGGDQHHHHLRRRLR